MPVLFTFDYPPDYGGIQRYAARLASELPALGMRVCVLVPPRRMPRFLRMAAGICALPFAYRAVADDWTCASSWYPAGLLAALLPHALRGNLLVLAHGTEIAARGGSLRDRLLRWTLARADRVIANSNVTATRVRAFGVNGQLAVIPCGVDPRNVEPARSDVPTILFVGRLVARKGVDRVIEALPYLRERFGRVRLEIIGDGPDRARLARIAADLQLDGAVKFFGAVNDAERDRAYARAWCFAMPVRAEGDDVEGFGIVYLEAAMAGLPSLGGRGSGAEDAILDGETGVIVDGGDTVAIREALAHLIGDPARAHTMGSNARERALRDFTWSSNARRIRQSIG
jgi:phosphatidyl-myo-inositol dimannoside synthase